MGFFDSLFGASSNKTSTVPWGPQQPHLQLGFDYANSLFLSGGPKYYDRPRWTPKSPQTEMAMGLRQGRALQGSPLNFAAQGAVYNQLGHGPLNRNEALRQYGSTARGDYLGSNPYLTSMANNMGFQVGRNFNENIMPGINATFAGAGRTGSGAHAIASGRAAGDASRAVSDATTSLLGRSYESERGRMQQASNGLMQGYANDVSNIGRYAQMAPQLAATDYQDIDQLQSVGYQVEGLGRDIVGDDRDRYDYYMSLPERNLETYMRTVSGNFGNTTHNTTPSNVHDTVNNAAWLAAMAGAFFSDIRLKENVRPLGITKGGHVVFSWEWNEEGKKLAGDQPTVGVIAQLTEPHLVELDETGYLKVDYTKLAEEISQSSDIAHKHVA